MGTASQPPRTIGGAVPERTLLAASYLGITYETWTLWVAAANLAVVVLATLFGLRQLRSLASEGRFNGAIAFQELTRNHEQSVWHVLEEFPVVTDVAEIDALDSEMLRHARLVVNALNDIGQLVEERMVDQRLYFGLMHGQILRLVFLLEPFLRYEESKIGGRYGRRLLRIANRARRYHDMRSIHRTTMITVRRGATVHEVYRTQLRQGWRGLLQRTRWAVQFRLKRY
jgi:hypothetical protein